jgi:hypothetical protein
MTIKSFAVLLMALAVGSLGTASAQITIPLPGSGGGIQIGPQQQRGPGEVFIKSATYGGNCGGVQPGNMTRELIDTCGGRQFCAYRVDYRVVGDPQRGCAKNFVVSFTCHQGEQDRWATLNPEASGQIVHLDCRR